MRQSAFDNFSVVPPGTGICHQVGLEFCRRRYGPVAVRRRNRIRLSDTLVGTDSHTTMVNGLSVLGWGVGRRGRAAMLGQPLSVLLPEVIGFKLIKSEASLPRTWC
jgi:aconitate hydratase